MNIVKKVIDLEINGEKLVATFDMLSIATYKKLTGKSVLKGMQGLAEMDEEVILNFMASTIREDEKAKPIGEELFEKYDILGLLLNFTEPIMGLIADSMPKQQKGGKAKKK